MAMGGSVRRAVHSPAMAAAARDETLRARIETGIGLVAPLLDLLLAIGDRLSGVLGSEEPDQLPAHVRRDGARAARGISSMPQR